MFDQETLNNLKQGFKKGKLKGLSNLDPQRLSLHFGSNIKTGNMTFKTVRILIDKTNIISAGFGKLPKKDKYIMFTLTNNSQGYELSKINQMLKPLKIQASLSQNKLLLITDLTEKSFFDDLDKFLKANSKINH